MNHEEKAETKVFQDLPKEDTSSYRKLSPFWSAVLIVLTVLGVFIGINNAFFLRLLGTLEYPNSYLYTLLATFMSTVFLVFPATKKASKQRVPWYDVLLFVLTLGISTYFAIVGYDILSKGWDFMAPTHITILAFVYSLLALEALRRAGGKGLFIVALIFALYPCFAGRMPGFLQGLETPFVETITYHALGTSSLLGISMGTFGDLLIGFLIFGSFLTALGGGQFFFDVALGLFGKSRGGIAKVAVVGSAFFGSISGSVISNILTTGSITIPAMKKQGYEPHVAGAVEACSSTGGCITPPIMGSTAFLMAAWIGVPYFKIALAAIVPIFLYYYSMYLQVDSYAAIHNFKGLEPEQIPPLSKTLKNGWGYLVSIVLLIVLMFMGKEAQAPYIATLFMAVICMFNKNTRLTLSKLKDIVVENGRMLGMVIAIMAGVGFITGSFALTGLGPAFTSEVVTMAGGNLILLLVLGALTSFILGMGMTITACYLFLAIVLAPVLEQLNLNTMAVHFYILYWGVASYITPPVALGSYTASVVAGATPIKTGLQSMKFGIVLYMVPFFFVARPELLLQGAVVDMIVPLLTCIVGVFFISAGLSGYFQKLGKLNMAERVAAAIGGLLVSIPETTTDIIGLVLMVAVVGIHLLMNRNKTKALEA